MHRFHHVLDHWIEKFARFFRIAVGEQLHRPFHVGEQHRDLLALAFEGAFGCENFFGEMLRGIDFGRRKLRGNLLRRSERLPAPSTKLFSGFV